MNTPYNLANKFLEQVLQVSDKVVTIQSLNWLLGKKQNTKITKYFDEYGGEIETINGNEYFDAIINADLSINYINLTKKDKLIYNNEEYEKCNKIMAFSHDKYLVEFNDLIGNINNSLWDNIKHNQKYGKGYVSNQDPNEWCIKISELRGHVQRGKQKHSDDFYTIIPKEEKTLNDHRKGKYSFLIDIKNPNRNARIDFAYFAFDSENILNNFINYLKTDFVRTCLMLLKIHSNQFRGCLSKVPWLDFSQDIFSKSPKEIDDYLFKKYDISDEIRKHIEEILPDYYNIRK